MVLAIDRPDSLAYPAWVKPLLDASGPITFSDRIVSTDEIWRFMTEEAPVRFPYAFDPNGFNIARLSSDYGFVSGLKAAYLTLTLLDRIIEKKAAGVPAVLIQGGQNFEPYFAAGAVPLRPAYVILWGRDQVEGLDLRGSDVRGNEILEAGRRRLTIEACHQLSAHAAIHEGIVDVDLIAPNLALRCSDMAYLTESHRSGDVRTPTYIIDYPVGDQARKPWAKTYLAENLRGLVRRIDEITGRTTTDEDVREQIRLHNRLRALVREFEEVWQSAKVPPTNSTDHSNILLLGNEPSADPLAVISVLEGAVAEVKQRVADGVKGEGLADDPARLYVCGSCVTANPNVVDAAGGVVVGKDDGWSQTETDAVEDGDPYEAIATQMLSWPYEQPTADRAEWTARQVERTHADGLLFIYNWGCNYQSAIARFVADDVKVRTKKPTSYLFAGELGKSETLEQSTTRVEAFIEMLRARKGVL